MRLTDLRTIMDSKSKNAIRESARGGRTIRLIGEDCLGDLIVFLIMKWGLLWNLSNVPSCQALYSRIIPVPRSKPYASRPEYAIAIKHVGIPDLTQDALVFPPINLTES